MIYVKAVVQTEANILSVFIFYIQTSPIRANSGIRKQQEIKVLSTGYQGFTPNGIFSGIIGLSVPMFFTFLIFYEYSSR